MAQILKYRGQIYQRVDTDLEAMKAQRKVKLSKAISEVEDEYKNAQKALANYLKDITGYKLAIQKGDFVEAFKIAEQIRDSHGRFAFGDFLAKVKALPENTRRFGGLGSGEIN